MSLLENTLPMNTSCNTKEEKDRKSAFKRTMVRAKGKTKVRRYNMALPETVYEDLRIIADINDVTIAEVLRKYIKLGLIVSEIENTPSIDLVLREEGKPDKTLVLI